jgi:hypothetical protein
MGIGGFLCLKLFYLLFYLYSFVFFHLNHITIIFFSFYFFEIKNNNQNSRRNNKEEKITLGFCVFSCKFCLDLRHFPIRQQSSFYFFFSLCHKLGYLGIFVTWSQLDSSDRCSNVVYSRGEFVCLCFFFMFLFYFKGLNFGFWCCWCVVVLRSHDVEDCLLNLWSSYLNYGDLDKKKKLW